VKWSEVYSKPEYTFTPLEGTYIELGLLPQRLVRHREQPHGAALRCDAVNLCTHTQTVYCNISHCSSWFSYSQLISPFCTILDPPHLWLCTTQFCLLTQELTNLWTVVLSVLIIKETEYLRCQPLAHSWSQINKCWWVWSSAHSVRAYFLINMLVTGYQALFIMMLMLILKSLMFNCTSIASLMRWSMYPDVVSSIKVPMIQCDDLSWCYVLPPPTCWVDPDVCASCVLCTSSQ
jgi:hypothetical protein